VLPVAKVMIGEGDTGLEHWQNDADSGRNLKYLKKNLS
jgi:hypothetical protein